MDEPWWPLDWVTAAHWRERRHEARVTLPGVGLIALIRHDDPDSPIGLWECYDDGQLRRYLRSVANDLELRCYLLSLAYPGGNDG